MANRTRSGTSQEDKDLGRAMAISLQDEYFSPDLSYDTAIANSLMHAEGGVVVNGPTVEEAMARSLLDAVDPYALGGHERPQLSTRLRCATNNTPIQHLGPKRHVFISTIVTSHYDAKMATFFLITFSPLFEST